LKRYKNNCILAFGDTHAPYHQKGTLGFLNKVKEDFRPDRVIHLGDLLDIYSVSSYPKDLNHPDSWTDELKKGREFVGELSEMFPDMELLSSNHDARVYTKSHLSGIPREFLVPYLDVIGAPSSWKLYERINLTVDKGRSSWLFSHTLVGGAARASKDLGTSVVLGHSHTKFGATAFRSGKETIWGVDAGCLISDKGSPYSYNKNQLGRPIHGCVVILNGFPIMIPFH